MKEFETIHKTTVKVVCGGEQGTAFFITPNKLLTAWHVVANSVNGEDVFTSYGIKCAVKPIKDNVDVALLTVENDYNAHCVSLLAMPKTGEQPLTMYGFPNSRIGTSVGIDYSLRTSAVYKGLDSDDFDAYAEMVDNRRISQFRGYSGSPIFVEDESVIGIVTNQLDGYIGYVSIENIKNELEAEGIEIDTNSNNHDDSPYGGKRCRDLTKHVVNRVGERYKEKVHQDDKGLATILKSIRDAKAYADECKNLEEALATLNSKYSVDIKYDDLEKLIIQDYRDKLQDNDQKIEITKGLEEILSQYDKIEKRKRCLIVSGNAGTGKTQQMCHFACTSNERGTTQTYLFLGSDFDTTNNETIEEQISRLCGFSSKEYLKELNEKAANNGVRYFFIIDALNEGLNDSYWEGALKAFAGRISTFGNLAFVVTIRSPFDRLYGLTEMKEFDQYRIKGFDNPDAACKDYFREYNIIPNHTLNVKLNDGLLLSTYCSVYRSIDSFKEKELNSLIFLFTKLVEIRNRRISQIVDEDTNRNISDIFLRKLAKASLLQNCSAISRKTARNISRRTLPLRFWSNSLLGAMLKENLLLGTTENKPYDSDDTVGFEYELMEDVYRAMAFFDIKYRDKQWKLNHLIELSKQKENRSRINDFIAVVCGLWSEVYGKEIAEEEGFSYELLGNFYIEGLRYKKEPLASTKQAENFFKQKGKLEGYKILLSQYFDLDDANYVISKLDILKTMSLHERDMVWTEAVNYQYDEDNMLTILATFNIHDMFYNFDGTKKRTNKLQIDKHTLMLCWICASSYPIVRAYSIRRMAETFVEMPSLVIEMIDKMHDVDDPYIIEGLYAAVYGYMLVSEDKKLIGDIAKKVYEYNFDNKSPMPDVVVRDWMLRILDKDRAVNGSDYFERAKPPYKSEPLDLNYEIDNIENFFGTSVGSRKLQYSLLSRQDMLDSDFNRYILGSNSSNVSRVLTTNPLESSNEDNSVMLDLRLQEQLMAKQIIDWGWNDELGHLDDTRTTPYRSENEIERIGKKYQWMALHNVEARMMDYYRMVEEFSSWQKYNKEYIATNYPWLSKRHPYFDPTLTLTKEFVFDEFKIPTIDFHAELEDNEWVKAHFSNDDVQPVMEIKGEDDDWVLLMSWHFLHSNDNHRKDGFIYCNSLFVENNDADKFQEWAKEQSFVGRWMPEPCDNINHLLLEYPWTRTIDFSKYEKEDYVGENCPCDIFHSTYVQLQENTMGAYQDQSGSVTLPSYSFMEKFNLHVVPTSNRCDVCCADNESKIHAYTHYKDAIHTLYVRRESLLKYLQENKRTLFYYLISERSLVFQRQTMAHKEYSSVAKYDEDGLQFVRDFVEDEKKK